MENLKDSFSPFKKIKEVIADWNYYLSLFLGFLPGPLIIAAAIFASKSLPVWIISLAIIVGWCVFNISCWSYEAWRASGPRGVFINTCGTTYNMLNNLIWLFFGFFIMLFNILLRYR